MGKSIAKIAQIIPDLSRNQSIIYSLTIPAKAEIQVRIHATRLHMDPAVKQRDDGC